MLKVRLTADIRILEVQPVLLGLQKNLEVNSFCLGLMVDESSWDTSREVRFVTAKAQVQENLFRVIIPQVEYVHHTAKRGEGACVQKGECVVTPLYTKKFLNPEVWLCVRPNLSGQERPEVAELKLFHLLKVVLDLLHLNMYNTQQRAHCSNDLLLICS